MAAASSKARASSPQIASNPQARFRYELFEHFEAGIVLVGTEVKAAREGGVSLKEAFIRIHNDEAFLLGCHIAPYSNAGYASHEPTRQRKLLMHKRELRKLHGKMTLRGYTIVPLRMYLKNGRVKVEIALAQGKKLHDKRETKRARVVDREAQRAVANR